jgi:hypothetical protein
MVLLGTKLKKKEGCYVKTSQLMLKWQNSCIEAEDNGLVMYREIFLFNLTELRNTIHVLSCQP